MPALVRIAERLREAPGTTSPRPGAKRRAERLREAPRSNGPWSAAERQTEPARLRWDVWLAVATSAGFLALLAADAMHPLLVVALEVFLLF